MLFNKVFILTQSHTFPPKTYKSGLLVTEQHHSDKNRLHTYVPGEHALEAASVDTGTNF